MGATRRTKSIFRDFNVDPLTEKEILQRFAGREYLLAEIAQFAGITLHQYQLYGFSSLYRYQIWCAGRRGGKTEGAAVQAVLCANPKPYNVYKRTLRKDHSGKPAIDAMGNQIFEYALDSDGNKILERESTIQKELLMSRNVDEKKLFSGNPIIGAVVTPNAKNFAATFRLFFKYMERFVGKKGKDWEYNKVEGKVSIPNHDNPESIIYFKSAHDPENLKGDGFAWAWWDEPGSLKSADAWEAFEPALQDWEGVAFFTTTPSNDDAGDNAFWFYDEFIDPEKFNEEVECVTWYSIHNVDGFKRSVWERLRARKHPLVFAREYMAEWVRGGGNELKLSWLTEWAYDFGDRNADVPTGDLDYKDGVLNRDRYKIVMGVDPAISTSEAADFTVVTVLAQDLETGQVYIVDQRRRKVAWADQVPFLKGMINLWKPDLTAIESNQFQIAVSQNLMMDPQMARIMPVNSRGNKKERIRSMSPAFKEGNVRVPRTESILNNDEFAESILAFYHEWENFPDKKFHDDTLDSVDIGIRALGVLSPHLDLYRHNVDSRASAEYIAKRANNPDGTFTRSLLGVEEFNKYTNNSSKQNHSWE